MFGNGRDGRYGCGRFLSMWPFGGPCVPLFRRFLRIFAPKRCVLFWVVLLQVPIPPLVGRAILGCHRTPARWKVTLHCMVGVALFL